MELTSPKVIKEILSKYEARPSKGLGQNFLIDKRILEKIIIKGIKDDIQYNRATQLKIRQAS